jgi:hypothetical protein
VYLIVSACSSIPYLVVLSAIVDLFGGESYDGDNADDGDFHHSHFNKIVVVPKI